MLKVKARMTLSWLLDISQTGRSFLMSPITCFFVLQLLLAWSRVLLANERRGSCLITPRSIMSIGAVLDLGSLMGKQQKIAMEIAVQEFNRLSCSKLDLKIRSSHVNSAQTVAGAMDLAQSKEILAIIGTITHSEACLASEINSNTKSVPILSLTSPAASTEFSSPPLPNLIQVSDDFSLHMQCIAAIVGEFRWRKVTAIYELNNGFSSDPGVLISLSHSLRLVGSEIDNQLALPSLSSLSDPKSRIENELNNLKRKSNRVFLIVHSSLELASMLCEKAQQMGLMEKGSVWVIPDGVAGLLDSVNSSVISNMQGVIGFKTHFMETSDAKRKFKLKFRRRFASEYPEEENITPSVFAFQSYDATWAIAQAARKSKGKFSLKELSEEIMSSKFDALTGKNGFTNKKLPQSPTFTIINVIGKSYREMAFWSPALGFSKNIVRHKLVEINKNNDSSGVLSTVYWPGGSQLVPKGWTHSNEERPLKIAVHANGAFKQFVNVTYDESLNETHINGFSIHVFKDAVKRLPYHLSYEFVPFNGSYDEMVKQVSNQTVDAAVGDISILSYRYHLVEFSQPYVDSGLDMVVTEKPDKSKQTWMFMDAFTKEMWFMMVAVHVFVGLVFWLIEREVNEELQGFGAMTWFLVTVIFFAHREPIRSPLARSVLAPWLFVILIVTSSFTASLTSTMTVSKLEPSVLDIQTLQKRNALVACNGKSFIVRYLIDVLKFKPENIRRIDSITDYLAAFKNNDVEAAFFVAPHAKVFLAKYSCEGFIKSGNTFRLDGFGFVFPKKSSSLAGDISEALLGVIESGETEQLEKDMLSTASCSPKAKDESPLGYQPFLGLFCICAAIATLALLYIMICLLLKNVGNLVRHLKAALTQLKRIGRWTTANFARIYSKVQSRSMRRVSAATERRNVEETVTNSEHCPVVVELV